MLSVITYSLRESPALVLYDVLVGLLLCCPAESTGRAFITAADCRDWYPGLSPRRKLSQREHGLVAGGEMFEMSYTYSEHHTKKADLNWKY